MAAGQGVNVVSESSTIIVMLVPARGSVAGSGPGRPQPTASCWAVPRRPPMGLRGLAGLRAAHGESARGALGRPLNRPKPASRRLAAYLMRLGAQSEHRDWLGGYSLLEEE